MAGAVSIPHAPLGFRSTVRRRPSRRQQPPPTPRRFVSGVAQRTEQAQNVRNPRLSRAGLRTSPDLRRGFFASETVSSPRSAYDRRAREDSGRQIATSTWSSLRRLAEPSRLPCGRVLRGAANSLISSALRFSSRATALATLRILTVLGLVGVAVLGGAGLGLRLSLPLLLRRLGAGNSPSTRPGPR